MCGWYLVSKIGKMIARGYEKHYPFENEAPTLGLKALPAVAVADHQNLDRTVLLFDNGIGFC